MNTLTAYDGLNEHHRSHDGCIIESDLFHYSIITTLDLEVKNTSSTCKISWMAELNPLSIANLLSLIHNLQTVKIDKKFSKLCRLRHLSIVR